MTLAALPRASDVQIVDGVVQSVDVGSAKRRQQNEVRQVESRAHSHFCEPG